MLFQIFIDIVLQNVRIMLRLEAESINERPNAVKPRFALSVLRDRTGGGVIIAAVIASAAILFANFFMWVSSRE